jgi:hypothetical protein
MQTGKGIKNTNSLKKRAQRSLQKQRKISEKDDNIAGTISNYENKKCEHLHGSLRGSSNCGAWGE